MKTRSTAAILLTAAVLHGATGCDESDYLIDATPIVVRGNGRIVEQSRTIGEVVRIEHRGVGDLYIEQGSRPELRVRAEENLLPYLQTDSHARDLLIWKEGATLLNTHPIEYRLTLVDLSSVMLTGAGLIRATDLDTGPLSVRLTGAGDVELLGLNAPTLTLVGSGVGTATVSGSVQEQTIRLSGIATYDGRHLESLVADVSTGGIGSATVRVRDRLTATIKGSGSIFYIGDPTVESVISGSGGVVKLGE